MQIALAALELAGSATGVPSWVQTQHGNGLD